MYKKLFVAALIVLALTSINARQANAQSCQTSETYGVRPPFPVDRNLQSQIEVTYFTTDDPNVFMSEKLGVNRSFSYLKLNTNQFVAKLETLEKNGLASIRKQQSASSYLGEVAAMNLERNSVNGRAGTVNASWASTKRSDLSRLDRESEISVFKGSLNDGDYYRVSLLSWFVNVTAKGSQKTLDYDAIILLKPGQTAVFKLMSDDEAKRNTAARSYVAVTMRSVDNAGIASLRRSR